jgi:hypothetical protein
MAYRTKLLQIAGVAGFARGRAARALGSRPLCPDQQRAAIDVENPAFVPQRFRPVMANDWSVHECRVAWIQNNRIGLTFVDTL